MGRLATALGLAAIALAFVAVAQGQLVQKGNLRVSFDGSLSPRALPRDRPAPVTVHLTGTVTTTDGSSPPQLRQLSVGVNRAGQVSTAGLPTCAATQLQQTTTEAALASCRGALVGHGRFAANVDFPGAPLIPAHGKVLVFNSRVAGQEGMLLHLYGSVPVKAAFVLPFRITRPSGGEFGTVFSAKIPKLASDLGYVTEIELSMGRRYTYQGESRSFVSASCAAPAGFPAASYPLARAIFSFPGGMRLISRLSGNCRVR